MGKQLHSAILDFVDDSATPFFSEDATLPSAKQAAAVGPAVSVAA